jgi:hypothetical protein
LRLKETSYNGNRQETILEIILPGLIPSPDISLTINLLQT